MGRLDQFKGYYDGQRARASLDGKTPRQVNGDLLPAPDRLDRFAWILCGCKLFQAPMAV